MTLAEDWKIIIRYAWSIRWSAAATVFGALAGGWPFASGLILNGEPWMFFLIATALPILSAGCAAAATVTRLLDQKNYPGDKS